MDFVEKELQCSECGAAFAFTVEEQEFFKSRGYTNEPKRCPACREARRTNRYDSGRGSGYSSRREMYPVVCAQCGVETQVPFQPRNDRPVYCSDCYRKIRLNR